MSFAPSGDFAGKMKEDDVDLYTLDVVVENGDSLAIAADKGLDFDFIKGKWVLRCTRAETTH